MAGDRKVASSRTRKRRNRSKGSVWPAVLVLGVLALLAVALYAMWQNNSTQGPPVAVEVNGRPSIKVDKPETNLGDIKLGKTVQTSFRVMNVGDQPLTITEKPYVEVVEGC